MIVTVARTRRYGLKQPLRHTYPIALFTRMFQNEFIWQLQPETAGAVGRGRKAETLQDSCFRCLGRNDSFCERNNPGTANDKILYIYNNGGNLSTRTDPPRNCDILYLRSASSDFDEGLKSAG